MGDRRDGTRLTSLTLLTGRPGQPCQPRQPCPIPGSILSIRSISSKTGRPGQPRQPCPKNAAGSGMKANVMGRHRKTCRGRWGQRGRWGHRWRPLVIYLCFRRGRPLRPPLSPPSSAFKAPAIFGQCPMGWLCSYFLLFSALAPMQASRIAQMAARSKRDASPSRCSHSAR